MQGLATIFSYTFYLDVGLQWDRMCTQYNKQLLGHATSAGGLFKHAWLIYHSALIYTFNCT